VAFEGVESGVVEEAELEGEVFADKEPTDDPDSAGLTKWGVGEGGDEGCGSACEFVPVLGEDEGGVKFDSEDAVCVRGAYGGDGGRDGVDGDELSLEARCEEGNVGKGDGVA
jgi:hypothetical protein